jgi:predicted PurR-regulated permease PerM
MLQNKNVRLFLGLFGVAILGYIVWNVRSIIYYFFAAAIIAFLARPLMTLLSKVKIKNWEIPNWLKSSLVLVAFIFIITGLFRLLIPTVIEQAHIISEIDAENIVARIQPQIESASLWIKKANVDETELQNIIKREVTDIFSMGDIGNYVKGILNGITGSLIAAFSILFIFNETKDLLTRYFVGVVIQISIVMIVITVGLTILGVKNALLIGFIAGIFNIIPYIGPLMGALIGVSLAATGQLEAHPDLNLTSFVLTALIPFAVTQALDNFLLQPLIFSKSVKAHPLEIFLVILAAGSLAGVVGMIVAVPAYSFLRIVAKEFFNGYKVVQGLTKDL